MKPVSLLVLGTLANHKGLGLLLEVADELRRLRSPLLIKVLGEIDSDHNVDVPRNIEVLGPYSDGDLQDLIPQTRFDAFWFPAVAPETFSFTFSAALQDGRPIFCFDLGSFPIRSRGNPQVTLFPFELMLDPPSLANRLIASSKFL